MSALKELEDLFDRYQLILSDYASRQGIRVISYLLHGENRNMWNSDVHVTTNTLALGLFVVERWNLAENNSDNVKPEWRPLIEWLQRDLDITHVEIMELAEINRVWGVFNHELELRYIEPDEVYANVMTRPTGAFNITWHDEVRDKGRDPEDPGPNDLVHECIGPFPFRGTGYWISYNVNPARDMM